MGRKKPKKKPESDLARVLRESEGIGDPWNWITLLSQPGCDIYIEHTDGDGNRVGPVLWLDRETGTFKVRPEEPKDE